MPLFGQLTVGVGKVLLTPARFEEPTFGQAALHPEPRTKDGAEYLTMRL